MIMLQAIACSHGVEPVKNGTALTSTKATLRAQVYSAILRTSFAVLKAAAIENPRLTTVLTAVINAQKRKGMLIQMPTVLTRLLRTLLQAIIRRSEERRVGQECRAESTTQ